MFTWYIRSLTPSQLSEKGQSRCEAVTQFSFLLTRTFENVYKKNVQLPDSFLNF